VPNQRVEVTSRDGGSQRSDGGHGAQHGPDLLTSSVDEPRAEERLREALERSRARAWVGRHRPLLAGLVALLAFVAAGTWYVVTRPPPLDPVVNVSVVEFRDGASLEFDSQNQARTKMSYQVTAHVAGDVVAAIGIVGPGLTRPVSTIPTLKVGLPKAGSLGATVDCTDSTWWSAKDVDYRARVRRTDTYGRVTTYDAPLGQSNARWHAGVRSTCLRSFVKSLPAAVGSASVGPGHHKVDVTLTLTNPTRHALWAQATPFGDETVTTTRGALTPLPAGGTATIKFSMRSVDCANGTPHVPVAKDSDGQAIALPVYLTDTAFPKRSELAFGWPRVDPDSAELVNGQLATLCPRDR
jgi:hypothetical protein